jgi:hypothetical protein
METEPQRAQDQAPAQDDESPEDFKQEMESDPSRAPSDDEGLERERGG